MSPANVVSVSPSAVKRSVSVSPSAVKRSVSVSPSAVRRSSFVTPNSAARSSMALVVVSSKAAISSERAVPSSSIA